MNGIEITATVLILVAFIVSVIITLTTRKEPDNEDLEHFDHEHGEMDAR